MVSSPVLRGQGRIGRGPPGRCALGGGPVAHRNDYVDQSACSNSERPYTHVVQQPTLHEAIHWSWARRDVVVNGQESRVIGLDRETKIRT